MAPPPTATRSSRGTSPKGSEPYRSQGTRPPRIRARGGRRVHLDELGATGKAGGHVAGGRRGGRGAEAVRGRGRAAGRDGRDAGGDVAGGRRGGRGAEAVRGLRSGRPRAPRRRRHRGGNVPGGGGLVGPVEASGPGVGADAG